MPNDSIIKESIKSDPEDKTSKADQISDYEEDFNWEGVFMRKLLVIIINIIFNNGLSARQKSRHLEENRWTEENAPKVVRAIHSIVSTGVWSLSCDHACVESLLNGG